MERLKQENGFTLVEILVAFSILMIVIFSFTLLFTSSFTWIFDAGAKGEALYKAQEEMDNEIAGGIISLDQEPMTIEFTNIVISVKGETKQIEHQYEERNVTITYFLPETIK